MATFTLSPYRGKLGSGSVAATRSGASASACWLATLATHPPPSAPSLVIHRSALTSVHKGTSWVKFFLFKIKINLCLCFCRGGVVVVSWLRAPAPRPCRSLLRRSAPSAAPVAGGARCVRFAHYAGQRGLKWPPLTAHPPRAFRPPIPGGGAVLCCLHRLPHSNVARGGRARCARPPFLPAHPPRIVRASAPAQYPQLYKAAAPPRELVAVSPPLLNITGY